MKIPSYQSISKKNKKGTELTAIETFVCEWKPAGREQSKNFRELLSAALDESKNL